MDAKNDTDQFRSLIREILRRRFMKNYCKSISYNRLINVDDFFEWANKISGKLFLKNLSRAQKNLP